MPELFTEDLESSSESKEEELDADEDAVLDEEDEDDDDNLDRRFILFLPLAPLEVPISDEELSCFE